jgi:hypothetical protein
MKSVSMAMANDERFTGKRKPGLKERSERVQLYAINLESFDYPVK